MQRQSHRVWARAVGVASLRYGTNHDEEVGRLPWQVEEDGIADKEEDRLEKSGRTIREALISVVTEADRLGSGDAKRRDGVEAKVEVELEVAEELVVMVEEEEVDLEEGTRR
ncbi:hypothetical protein E2562_020832 [Oryza meyeriana var. granulata]|uniref:DUF834 domain-containing protein n=1 Tax=Oryza meyeriana var. granulata TaxID=110450 RepID=A0A6G1CIR5_9ORYZ|nr:hypothetical protein E2562_020832 [Oryza meyeriana var. granulata]